LFRLAPVAALHDLADGFLRLLLEARQRRLGAALQLFQLGFLALLPLGGQLLLAARQIMIFIA
jgi:hypothetical protein